MTDEAAEQWRLVRTPLGEPWSGRARYAAAMFFYQRGDLGPEALEIYRLCARLDGDDPVERLRERGLDPAWVEKILEPKN